MSDFFDDDDFDVTESQKKEKQNLVYFLIFGGVVLLVFFIILAVSEDSKKNNPRSSQYHSNKDRRDLYRKRRPGKNDRKIVTRQHPKKEKGTITPNQHRPSLSGNQLHLSVVRIHADRSFGSGTLLSRKGYFLTNEHVVKSSRYQFIYFSRDPKVSPKKYFATETVWKSRQMDLAVLQIVKTFANASLSHMIPAKMGNSSSLKLGDKLIIYGYPGIGGRTITLTTGVISGFLQDSPPRIKTDANISSGNSGGAAFNKKGEFVGVPTAGAVDERLKSQIGLIRPINTIKKHIRKYL